ncbi:hypothetical protein BBJ28_00015167 [Nothophytophthora sp. Chile5]|nr:hypothetical protein BBJ28_00015167 [Nothophytophthora sp. Chile5]
MCYLSIYTGGWKSSGRYWVDGRPFKPPQTEGWAGIQMRRVGRALGKRKRRHRTSEAEEEEDADEEGTEEDADGGAPASQRGIVQKDCSGGEGEDV